MLAADRALDGPACGALGRGRWKRGGRSGRRGTAKAGALMGMLLAAGPSVPAVAPAKAACHIFKMRVPSCVLSPRCTASQRFSNSDASTCWLQLTNVQAKAHADLIARHALVQVLTAAGKGKHDE